METRNRHQSRSLPIIKQKSGLTNGIVLGRIFLSAKVCTSCVQPLGLFLSRGSNCPKCGLKVCKKCKVHAENLQSWICLVCSKESSNYGNKSMTLGGKGLKYPTTNNSYSNIKRSWSISAPPTNHGSPVLKAYTKYNNDDRGFNSLPRMPTNEAQGLLAQGQARGQSNQNSGRQRYGGGHSPAHTQKNNGRRPFEFPSSATASIHSHQSTLYPYLTNDGQRSPASSINFIEDEYWDYYYDSIGPSGPNINYYDYEINQSEDERSSCERSLGDTVEYKYQHFQDPYPVPPKKPARTKKSRSRSVGSYDTKQLKLYTATVTPEAHRGSGIVEKNVIQAHTVATYSNISTVILNRHQNLMYSSLPLKKRRSNSLDKENIALAMTFDTQTHRPSITESPSQRQRSLPPERPIRHKFPKEDFNSHSLPRRHGHKVSNGNGTSDHTVDTVSSTLLPSLGTNTYNTLPKEWKIFKRRDNNTTTIIISGVNSPPNPSDTSVLKRPASPANLSRTYISDTSSATAVPRPALHSGLQPSKVSHSHHRKFPVKELYPSFPSKIQPFKNFAQDTYPSRELKPLLPLYHGADRRRGLFNIPPPISTPCDILNAHSPRISPIPGHGFQNEDNPVIQLSQPLSGSDNVNIEDNILDNGTRKDNRHPREVIIEIEQEGINNRISNRHKVNAITDKEEHEITPDADSSADTITMEPNQTTEVVENSSKAKVPFSVSGLAPPEAPQVQVVVPIRSRKVNDSINSPKGTYAALPTKYRSLSDKNLWTLCGGGGGDSDSGDQQYEDYRLSSCSSTSECEGDSDQSECSFQSIVDNNSYNNGNNGYNNGIDNNGQKKGGHHPMHEEAMNKDKVSGDEIFESCMESEGEDDNEELEQIRRLLWVDTNLPVTPVFGLVSPIHKELISKLTQVTQDKKITQVTQDKKITQVTQDKKLTRDKLPKIQKEEVSQDPLFVNSQLDLQLYQESGCGSGSTIVENLPKDLQDLPKEYNKDLAILGKGLSDQGEARGWLGAAGSGCSGQDDDTMSLNSQERTSVYETGDSQTAHETAQYEQNHHDHHKESIEVPEGMNTDLTTNQNVSNLQSTNHHLRKYKSRVLIGLNDKTLQVKGEGEVEIVIGQGTFLSDEEFENKGVVSNTREPEQDSAFPCRESPEGEESGSEESLAERLMNTQGGGSSQGSQAKYQAPSRSEPDGADAEKCPSSDDPSSDGPSDRDDDEHDSGGMATPILEMNSEDEAKSESTDSWIEDVTLETDLPLPLDMTLHTICEESETESEYRRVTPINIQDSTPGTNQNAGLEQYFNFVADEETTAQNLHFDFQNYEESEFSDTFSESSFSSGIRNSSASDLRHVNLDCEEGMAVDLASGRLEKYFLNLGVGLNHDSDSVGSESESGSSVLENKKKVLKHHRRSAEYEDEHFQVSEDDDCAFEQEGFDTIKKQRKLRKSQEDLLSSNLTPGLTPGQTPVRSNASRKSSSETIAEEETTIGSHVTHSDGHPNTEDSIPAVTVSRASPELRAVTLGQGQDLEPPSPGKLKRVTVSRSNSFNWSSDEEVNLMMRSLRQLIKNMTLSKKTTTEEGKGDLMYLENELIRLMKTENVKTMVDTMSSESRTMSSEGQEQDVYKLMETVDSEPELLSKVMTHIGLRLSTWMKDEEEKEEGSGSTIKTAQSVSSDLNDDLESDTRFSWKGSFESTLAKRQSVGSSDSLDYYGPPQNEGQEVFVDRSILRSSSLHHLAHTQPILEESESLTSSLSRLNPVTSATYEGNSNNGKVNVERQVITKSKSLFLDPTSQQEVKSARYRPPGYFNANHTLSSDAHASTPFLSHRDRRERLKATSEVKDPGKAFAIRGLVEFSMQYNYKLSTFEVTIKQCRDLAAVDAKKARSDPYVKGYLLPDRSKSNKRKTKTKKNTLNPVFGETLKFPISLEELEARSLWLSVWHSDMFGKNEFLGQVTIPLRGLTFDDPNFTWYPLRDEKTQPPADGSPPPESPPLDLILALKWTPRGFSRDLGNLSVLFKEAKGLKLIKNTVPSTFIKCSPLSERSKKQKTTLAKRTTNPVWNATMTFENVTREGLEVTLYSSDRLNHEPIANVKLNCDFELWRNMERREGFWVEGIVPLTTTNY